MPLNQQISSSYYESINLYSGLTFYAKWGQNFRIFNSIFRQFTARIKTHAHITQTPNEIATKLNLPQQQRLQREQRVETFCIKVILANAYLRRCWSSLNILARQSELPCAEDEKKPKPKPKTKTKPNAQEHPVKCACMRWFKRSKSTNY